MSQEEMADSGGIVFLVLAMCCVWLEFFFFFFRRLGNFLCLSVVPIFDVVVLLSSA